MCHQQSPPRSRYHTIPTVVLDGWITRKSVTDPETWVYRATLHPIDTNGFKHGFVPSKAHKALRKSKWINDHAGFWDGNGPRLGVPPDADLQFAFQAMALRISSIPMSQFSSVALDFDVASGFGNEIYKFQLGPNAPIMGLDNCKLSGKEAQFQIADGTQLKHLKRNILGNSYWEDYDKITDQWVKSETFKSELRKRRDSTPLASFVHEGFYYSNSTSLFDDGTLSSFGTIQDCAKRCLSTSGCDFLTYAYDGWGSRGQYCTLFSADGFTPISDSDKNYSLFRLRDR
jgi:hypothetical protein